MTDEILEKIKNIASSSVEEARIQHLFTLSRKLIERVSDNERKEYGLLRFYCDWTMHSEIDRSKEGALILFMVHNTIHSYLKKKDNTGLINDLIAILSLEALRIQLNGLIAKFGGNSEVFSKDKWSEILPALLEIISRIPLKIGQYPRLSKISESIHSKPLKEKSVVEELSIAKGAKSLINTLASSDELIFYLVITTTDTTKFVIPILESSVLSL